MADQWKATLADGLAQLVDKAVTEGAKQEDVYATIAEEIDRLKVTDDRDPDPADTVSEQVVEEPANDWPVA
ncbi:hypothetical protein [Shinella oryzae]|jgi:hypothetical protein|uniref:Uncharacterized protein n=1 Tax=Shinella oryzae TaxID=2871820 RepID=A0ABY9KDU4_9HYPH|nr:hypothetical protein [Shinella oryzae]MDP9588461.1 hypothetical protein [Shinella zoogloeoides]WLS05147.1 hypothetical protein Q9315_23590 [Shinella oryzae]